MRERFKRNLVPWYEKYHHDKVLEIQNAIKSNPCSPVFNPKKWKGVKANCYAYALDINVSDPKKSIWTPGQISSKKYDHQVYNSVTDEVKKDLDFLGISYRDNSETLNPGEWRIAIYFSPTFHDWPIGFHFFRQDEDGTWSEKNGWSRNGKLERFVALGRSAPDLSNHNMRLEGILILSKK